MLNFITKSKIRQKILLLFLYHPERAYYINETAKIIKTSSGTAQRELEKLADSGFLKKEKNANLTYFRINPENPLLDDIKSITEKTIGLEQLLKDELGKLEQVKFAFLFGSYIKGDFKPDSDIDLYAIGDINENEFYKTIKTVEAKIMREVNYHLSSLEEFRKNLEKSFFHREILKNYQLLIGNENEFRKFIK
ncbi:MAG TPA: nucleotidyltransferase domain-containing protein [Patescibacteria group bacterium]|nr:nucleotidyltransferase domain-containing protein [Patescibacteria group bacterium]